MKSRVVQFHYTLKNKSGETLDSSRGSEPMSYLEGSGEIIPGLENALKTLKAGDKKLVEVKAAEAYGEYDKTLVMEVPRSQLPKTQKVQVGDQFSAGGQGQSAVFTAKSVTDTHVTLDGNHPLAGQDLSFDVEIVATREATAEELSHGHAHGGDGHHHH